jgi:hypothetical protein
LLLFSAGQRCGRLAVRAQQKPRRIGYLRLAPSDATQLADFRAGLEETGYAKGRNLVIEDRYADGDYARLPDLDIVDMFI